MNNRVILILQTKIRLFLNKKQINKKINRKVMKVFKK